MVVILIIFALSFSPLTSDNNCFIVHHWRMYVTNDIPDENSNVTILITSDERPDQGLHTLFYNQTFSWEFCNNLGSAGSDTRPPMLDMIGFASWKQHIRLYCLGKDNEVNIIKSIDEGPFRWESSGKHWLKGRKDNVKMLLEGSELTKDDRESQLYNKFEHFRQNKGETIHDYYVRGLKESNYDQLYAYLKQHEARANENKMMLERYNQHAIDPLALVSNVSPQQYPSQSSVRLTPNDNLIESLTNKLALLTQSYKAHLPQTNNQLRTSSNAHNQATVQDERIVVQNVQGRQNRGHIARNCTQPKRPQNSENIKDKMFLMQAQENGMVLDEDQLLFLAVDQCDAFDSDVDEAPTAPTMFMANLSSADPIYDEAGPSYDSDILSEVQDHDDYIDNVVEYQEYVKDNTEKVIQSNVSAVPNDALMMIINDMHKHDAHCVSANEHSKVVNASLTAELARYKEQIELYERWAKLELTEREQKKDEQLRIIITDRNIKEEFLKKELHSVKMQLKSTIGHNKPMRDEVAT
nr:hypothetical protein [Tanacetum cinerariifolium]